MAAKRASVLLDSHIFMYGLHLHERVLEEVCHNQHLFLASLFFPGVQRFVRDNFAQGTEAGSAALLST